MDAKDQVIFNLNREIELLRMENQYLKDQLQRYYFFFNNNELTLIISKIYNNFL